MHRTEGQNNVAGFFTGGPPATVVTPEWLNAVQEELLAVIAAGGESPLTVQTDTRTQLLQAIQKMIRQEPYDFVVYDQASFNALWTRTGANAYEIKDDYRSVLIRIPEGGGGYACTGALSFLSGGDAYGVLSTNNCTHLKMENGTYFDVGDSLTYVNVNTEGAKLENVWIKGNGTTAVAVAHSFYISVYRVIMDGCSASNRNISASHSSFQCQRSFILTKDTSQIFTDCRVFDTVSSTDFNAFYRCSNMTNCIVDDIQVGADSYMFGNCNNLSCCQVGNIISLSSKVIGFYQCYNISSSVAHSILTGNNGIVGFLSCERLSSCNTDEIDNNSAANRAEGFSGCSQLSSCRANDIDNAGAGGAHGFYDCEYVAACFTTEAVNGSNDWVDTVDADVTNKVSTPSVWTP